MSGLIRAIRLMGWRWTATTLAGCLLADAVRVCLLLTGEKQLATDLLAAERKLWQ